LSGKKGWGGGGGRQAKEGTGVGKNAFSLGPRDRSGTRPCIKDKKGNVKRITSHCRKKRENWRRVQQYCAAGLEDLWKGKGVASKKANSHRVLLPVTSPGRHRKKNFGGERALVDGAVGRGGGSHIRPGEGKKNFICLRVSRVKN